jgi:UDP-3-O-[3-hydroxymyristoyl] glucosamine N-acyltransferase
MRQGVVLEKTLKEIAAYVGGKIHGDGSVVIRGFAGLKEAAPGEISFLSNMKYASLLQDTQASAVFVEDGDFFSVKTNLVIVDNPSKAFSLALSLFVEDSMSEGLQGIHPSAVIAPTASIGKGVAVGACAVIEDHVVIGDHTRVLSGSVVGFKSRIGKDCLIYANVTLRERTEIGDRVIIHSGAVIGSDGFGFITEEGVHLKVPQVGIVQIEDDAEVGANVTIDRARFDRTVIGQGTKIDNLVQIAHNVRVGKNCLIVSQAGVSGSVVLGDNVILGGQCGIVGHVTVGDGSMIAAQSGVAQSVPPRSILFGSPAQPHMKAKRMSAAAGKLPEVLKVIRDLETRVRELEQQAEEKKK